MPDAVAVSRPSRFSSKAQLSVDCHPVRRKVTLREGNGRLKGAPVSGVKERLTYANIVATLALIIALGMGSAWAAGKLAKDSVKSKQIKAGAVKNSDLADNSVTSAKVADGSLLGGDFAAGQLPAGPQGPQGLQGDRGLPGADATKLFAFVGATGNLIYGSGATAATKLIGNGNYKVTFNRSLSNCVAMANVGLGEPDSTAGGGGGTEVANATNVNGDNTVSVTVFDANTGALDNGYFMLAVFC
jgi:hypothetical protein